VKLLAIAELVDGDRIAARVHPAMIPAAHPLAAVRTPSTPCSSKETRSAS